MGRTGSVNGLGSRLVRSVVLLRHSWKIRLLSRSLATALGESWQGSRWPGDRLAVGAELSDNVEKLTRLLNRETKVHGRLASLLK